MKSTVCFLAAILTAAGLLGLSAAQAQELKSLSAGPSISILPATSGGQFYALNAYMSILTKRMEYLRIQEINADRQKHLESETKKLLDLATDLDRDMRGGKELTPLDLSRRAAQIERLAHSVQERMRG
jgi:hypothetical protein